METWEDEVVVLSARACGEGHAVAAVFARGHGLRRGFVYGGSGRRSRAMWQPGTILAARFLARLPDQLGRLEGEPLFAASAATFESALALAVLASALAMAETAFPEAEPHPRVYEGLVGLLARLAHGAGQDVLADYVRWEVGLLADLGYGLDLSACAASGVREGLAFVSPRTGRAVSAAAAGPWRERLLPLPPFLVGEAEASVGDVVSGLRLTGHFLARDVFGVAHRPPPEARARLVEAVVSLASARPEPA